VEARVEGLWSDVTREPAGSLLRARAADQLMRTRRARLRIDLQSPAAGALRLVAGADAWDLPELRVRVPE
jgi:hypothetical protein